LPAAATNRLAALESLRERPVEVLFLDIQMPGLSGFELLARLPSQPLVIFTRLTINTRSSLRGELGRLPAEAD